MNVYLLPIIFIVVTAGYYTFIYRPRRRQHWNTLLGIIPECEGCEYVYFVLDNIPAYVKIGLTKNLDDRANAFQTAHPQPLELLGVLTVKDAKRAEEILHDRYRKYKTRVNGEWFWVNAELLELVSLCSDRRLTRKHNKRRRTLAKD